MGRRIAFVGAGAVGGYAGAHMVRADAARYRLFRPPRRTARRRRLGHAQTLSALFVAGPRRPHRLDPIPMPCGRKRKRHKIATHKRKKRLRKNRHKKKNR